MEAKYYILLINHNSTDLLSLSKIFPDLIHNYTLHNLTSKCSSEPLMLCQLFHKSYIQKRLRKHFPFYFEEITIPELGSWY